MAGKLIRRALRRSVAQIRYVSAVRPAAAQGLVATVYSQVERDFGMLAPPVALHSPAPGPLAACWVMLAETLLVPGLAGRAAKEAVAAAVSLGNTCPYCVAVHTAALHGLVQGPTAAAIAQGHIEPVADPQLRKIAEWAQASGQPRVGVKHAAPCPPEQFPELAGVAVTFQYLNRMVNVFLDESPLPPGTPARLGGGLMRLLGRIMLSAAQRSPAPGASLALLPAAPLPGDMQWAAGNRCVADAFARSAAAIESAGVQAVPAAVRELVLSELGRWSGRRPGPSRAWADDAASQLTPADRPAGRLALLTALASYQVGPSEIDAYRRGQPGDQALVALTSWASLAAARRVGTWLGDERLEHEPTR